MSKLITIVVPTYNMEKYLDRCLTSLFVPSELMELLEVLVINDGSKDKSSEIAHRYEKQYPEAFRVIDKENGNYGSCINRALKEATGKYIKVLDADDYFVTNNWETFLELLQQIDADMILTDYCLVDGNDTPKEYRRFNIVPNILQKAADVIEVFSEVEMHAVTYRRQLLLDMDYRQTEGISYTDTEWTTLPIMNVSSVFYIPIHIYNYLVGRSGQTVDPNIYIKKRHETYLIHNRILDFCIENHLLKGNISLFYLKRLKGIYNRLYAQSLIYRKFSSNELVAIDKKLHEKAPEIFEELSQSTFSKIRYVDTWRKNNYRIPSMTALKLYVIFLKRKYLPWMSIGRINS